MVERSEKVSGLKGNNHLFVLNQRSQLLLQMASAVEFLKHQDDLPKPEYPQVRAGIKAYKKSPGDLDALPEWK